MSPSVLRLPRRPKSRSVRPPQIDPRYTDLTFAVNDTFRRASRRLRDQARALQGRAKTAERPSARAVSEVGPNVLRAAVPHGAPTPVERATSHGQFLTHPVHSEAAGRICKLDALADNATRGQRQQSLGAPTPCQPPIPADPTAGESEHPEPTLVEEAGSEVKSAASLESEPPTIDVARTAAGAADIPSPEPTHATRAETAPDEPKLPAPVETAPAAPKLARQEAAAEPVNPASAIRPRGVAAANAQTRPSHPTPPVRMPMMTPLGFIMAMGNLVRTAAALNIASTNWMNSYFSCSAGILNSTAVRSPATDDGANVQDPCCVRTS